ncbi:MAG: hypothetical protein RBS39_11220 [Phycisphaerales bacterium]|nr:hypothetical protein [Phycisphaerales bacterium]
MTQTHAPSSQAFATIATLLAIAIGVVVAAGVLSMASASIDQRASSDARTRTRAIAASALHLWIDEATPQFEAILGGGDLELEHEQRIALPGGEGVARLMEWDASGMLVRPEAGAINVNRADREMLLAAGMDAKDADALLAARENGPIVRIEATGASNDGTEDADRIGSGARDGSDDGVWFTTLSSDVGLCSGVEGWTSVGDPRDRLTGKPDPELAAKVMEWDDGESLAWFAEVVKKGLGFPPSRSQFLVGLAGNFVPVEEWGGLLDATESVDAREREGLVSLNHAPAGVLAALPGMDADLAREIVARRESLDLASRRDIAWPAREGVMDEVQFVRLGWLVTTRSMQWSIRFEVGRVAIDDGASGGGEDQPLRDRMVLEAVLDFTEHGVRLARLRDVTLDHPEVRRALASALPVEDARRASDVEEEDEAAAAESEALGDGVDDGVGSTAGSGGSESTPARAGRRSADADRSMTPDLRRPRDTGARRPNRRGNPVFGADSYVEDEPSEQDDAPGRLTRYAEDRT